MKRFFSLVKIMFIDQYQTRSSLSSEKEKKARKRTVALYAILAVCFLPIFVSIAVAMYYMGQLSQGNIYLGTLLTLVCQGLVLVFGVRAIMSNVFVVNDADKLTYLPVRAHTIFLAKLTVAYINEVITSAVAIAVTMLPFGIGSGANFQYYLMLIPALVLIPMLPMLLGCLVSMPFSALIARFGKNSAVKTSLRIVTYVLIMSAYLYGVYSLGLFAGSGSDNFFNNPESFVKDLIVGLDERLAPVMPYFHPNYMLFSSMLATSFVSWLVTFTLSLVENALLLGVVFLVSLPFYRKMLTLSLEDGSANIKRSNSGFRIKNKGIVRELMLTDLKRTARDGQIGFQSFAGIIMMPVIVIILYFSMGIANEGDYTILELMNVSPLYQVIAPLMILAYMTFIGLSTNVLGLYPISRENKSAYMLKSFPVPFAKILLAKVLLATAVMIVSDFVTCVLIVALLGVKWYYGIAMLVTMALLGFGSMCITTLIDLKDPRLGWENFGQSLSLRNAKNVWIAMLIGALAVTVIALSSAAFVVWFNLNNDAWYAVLIMWIVILGVTTAFAAVSYKVMNGKATKYFEQIEI